MSPTPIDTVAAATLLRTLANPGRLQIVLRLLAGEAAVAELEQELGIRQPTLSQQLGELRDAGLVAGRREAKTVIYRLVPGRAERLVIALAHGFGADSPVTIAPAAPARSVRRAHLGAMFATVTAAD